MIRIKSCAFACLKLHDHAAFSQAPCIVDSALKVESFRTLKKALTLEEISSRKREISFHSRQLFYSYLDLEGNICTVDLITSFFFKCTEIVL